MAASLRGRGKLKVGSPTVYFGVAPLPSLGTRPRSPAVPSPEVGRKRLRSALAVAALVVAIAGCGSSESAAPVTRAADVTARAPGYQLAGTATVTLERAQRRSPHMTISGAF